MSPMAAADGMLPSNSGCQALRGLKPITKPAVASAPDAPTPCVTSPPYDIAIGDIPAKFVQSLPNMSSRYQFSPIATNLLQLSGFDHCLPLSWRGSLAPWIVRPARYSELRIGNRAQLGADRPALDAS